MEYDYDKYLGTKELSQSLLPWLTPGAIRNLVLRRKIPFRKVGGRLVFLRDEIEKWIASAPGVRLKDLEK